MHVGEALERRWRGKVEPGCGRFLFDLDVLAGVTRGDQSLAEEFCQKGTHATTRRSVGSRGLLFNGVGGEAVRKKPEDGRSARVEAVVVAVLQIDQHDVVVELLVQHLRGVDSIPITIHPKTLRITAAATQIRN